MSGGACPGDIDAAAHLSPLVGSFDNCSGGPPRSGATVGGAHKGRPYSISAVGATLVVAPKRVRWMGEGTSREHEPVVRPG